MIQQSKKTPPRHGFHNLQAQMDRGGAALNYFAGPPPNPPPWFPYRSQPVALSLPDLGAKITKLSYHHFYVNS